MILYNGLTFAQGNDTKSNMKWSEAQEQLWNINVCDVLVK